MAIGTLPDGNEHLFVGSAQNGVFRSGDGGKTYEVCGKGLTEPKIVGLTVSPFYAEDGRVFASTWNKGVFRSTDRGHSWKLGKKGLQKHVQADARKLPHFEQIRIPRSFDGDQPIFLGAYDGLFKSTDGGATWAVKDTMPLGLIIDLTVSPNFANDSTLAFCSYWKGVAISRDAGKTWKAMHRQTEIFDDAPRKIIRLHSIAFSPDYAEDGTLYVGVRNQLLKTQNDGKSWEAFDIFGAAGDDDVIIDRIAFSSDFKNDGVMFVGGRTGYSSTRRGAVYQSTDGGKSFNMSLELDELYLHSLVISPNFAEDGIVFASGGDGGSSLYRTTDAGENWSSLTDEIEILGDEGVEVAISPQFSHDGSVFCGTGKGLFQTSDQGDTWKQIPVLEPETSQFVQTIAISPDFAKDQTLLIALRGKGNFVSNDGGASFQSVAQDLLAQNHGMTKMWNYLPDRLIHPSPQFAEDQTAFGFANDQLFRTQDGGKSWDQLDLSGFEAQLQYLTPGSKAVKISTGLVLAILAIGYFLFLRRQNATS